MANCNARPADDATSPTVLHGTVHASIFSSLIGGDLTYAVTRVTAS
jgi:hypothetical protein